MSNKTRKDRSKVIWCTDAGRSVGIVTTVLAGQRSNRGSIPSHEKTLFSKSYRPVQGPSRSPIEMGPGAVFTDVKLIQYNTEVKNKQTSTSYPLHLPGVNWDIFIRLYRMPLQFLMTNLHIQKHVPDIIRNV
jgi:hypothetical protein